MNISYNWLREYVATDLAAREVAERLTRIGLNVDSVEPLPDGPSTTLGATLSPPKGGDTRLDVEVPANRPDCLGHLGVARELAAALGVPLRLPDAAYKESSAACDKKVRVEVEDLDLCPLYTARLIEGVKTRPSPDWLKARLEAVGIRPVSGVVDVTNYVMMETGQPLHAFDFARLAEGRIIVRRARPGERFTAIDHSEHSLSPERLVIADARRPVALAGVMGGADTEISDATTDILLEAAVFDPLNIRATSRTLGLASESSFRFERRVDAGGTDWASRRACALIQQVAGGRVARGVVTAGRPLPEPRELALRIARIETVLGLAIPADAAAECLRRLGLEILERSAERLRVRVPSWRPDLEREIDLVEEVARHHGYEKIPESREIPVAYAAPSRRERVRRVVEEVLVAAGYFEAVTFTFTSAERAARFRPADVEAEPIALRGTPLSLRQSVLPGLLDSLRVNQNAGETGARLFEMARRFLPAEGDLPDEREVLALAAAADPLPAVKGVIEALVERLGLESHVRFTATDRCPDLAAGQAAEVHLDGKSVGLIGVATADAAGAFELDQTPTVAELDLERLGEAARLEPTYKPLPQFPSIERDLAIVVDEKVRWADIQQAVADAKVPEAETVEPLDIYRGRQVPPGKKSVALRIVLRSPRGTLKHEQAETMQARILEALQSRLGAVLRS